MDRTRGHTGAGQTAGRIGRGVLAGLVSGAVLLITVSALAFRVSELSSVSMSPTLRPGDWVLVNRLIYRLRSPRRGDIVMFHFPQTGGREFVKRVIALPGDVVAERDGRLTVNGLVVHASRTRAAGGRAASTTTAALQRVPADRLYVLGDNWKTSLDSRFWGTVDERQVVGEAILICWSSGRHWWDVRWSRVGRRLE